MVAIKDMAIPSCCGGCDFCTEYWECILLRKRVDNIVGTNAKHSDCPLVEIEERRTGQWEDINDPEEWYGDQFKCSACGWVTLDNGSYCPNCGADMRGSEE